ncbi:MAG: hypothetical protein UU65_C0010G0006 [candidate division CPR2 bacterium GW2011_GWC1_41_48]|uniref:Uncharacterized protein n=1 Tax=candidate division CPR2 bacterium GW2011_GWC1_41_48 TaxID=1618344 RepID=A0A0G0W6A6_UNCC2|nr:MAG: hypothetical protein UT47_C0009G0006 [candidate division CPR2 bacterium GW2011_GWC2_39_35]KKS08534.1 MAG: hypothetical protein UU65_C0010G0006 [candidate division CPR2 bacterium GW2011_GWC1_41_48]HCL99730.1 hypothetical protein [candidate division CPR2 bacterium]
MTIATLILWGISFAGMLWSGWLWYARLCNLKLISSGDSVAIVPINPVFDRRANRIGLTAIGISIASMVIWGIGVYTGLIILFH